MNLNGEEYYYIRNGQGDIIGLFDSSGTEVVRYYYNSWGKLISIDGTLKDTIGVKNPYRYRGYRYDGETGLYYLQSRYYNAEWCRFINGDSFLGMHGMLLSHNLFAYCQNNPINNSDSSGYFWDIVLDIISMAQSIRDIFKNPTSGKAWAALATDVAFAAVPGLTGGGAMVRTASKVEKVADIANIADKGYDVAKGTDKVGIIYKRTNVKTGKDYVGQTKSPERFLKRQKEHARKNPSARYEYEIIGREVSGKSLDILEQRMINKYGGLEKTGGLLENKRNQISPKYWDYFNIK